MGRARNVWISYSMPSSGHARPFTIHLYFSDDKQADQLKVLHMLFPDKPSDCLKSVLLQCGNDVLSAIEHVRNSTSTDVPLSTRPEANQSRSRSPLEPEKRKEPCRRKKKSSDQSKGRFVIDSPPRSKKAVSPPKRGCWSPNDRFTSPTTQPLTAGSPDSPNGGPIMSMPIPIQPPSQISRISVSNYGHTAISPTIIPTQFSAARLFRSAFAAPTHSAGAFCPAGLAAAGFFGFQHGHPHQPYSTILPGHSSLLYPPTASMLQSYAPPPPPPSHPNPNGAASCSGSFLRFPSPHFSPTFGSISQTTSTATDHGSYGTGVEESQMEKVDAN